MTYVSEYLSGNVSVAVIASATRAGEMVDEDGGECAGLAVRACVHVCACVCVCSYVYLGLRAWFYGYHLA